MRLRFGAALSMSLSFNGHSTQDFLIPPISAFVALENAVKHNEIGEQAPLEIRLKIAEEILTISNRLQPKRSIQHSSHIGLTNLDERFKIITGKNIQVVKDDKYFEVRLPLTLITN